MEKLAEKIQEEKAENNLHQMKQEATKGKGKRKQRKSATTPTMTPSTASPEKFARRVRTAAMQRRPESAKTRKPKGAKQKQNVDKGKDIMKPTKSRRSKAT